mmetsp:Transcript_129533/g.235447  ORF Transcript_129533/g.235447 Transcript_129533/m.235447 type:complete len:237 (-) Transcript_129533:55-765(-)
MSGTSRRRRPCRENGFGAGGGAGAFESCLSNSWPADAASAVAFLSSARTSLKASFNPRIPVPASESSFQLISLSFLRSTNCFNEPRSSLCPLLPVFSDIKAMRFQKRVACTALRTVDHWSDAFFDCGSSSFFSFPSRSATIAPRRGVPETLSKSPKRLRMVVRRWCLRELGGRAAPLAGDCDSKVDAVSGRSIIFEALLRLEGNPVLTLEDAVPGLGNVSIIFFEADTSATSASAS